MFSQYTRFIPETDFDKKIANKISKKHIKSIQGIPFLDTIAYKDKNKRVPVYKVVYDSSGKKIINYSKKRKENKFYLSTKFNYNNVGQLVSIIEFSESGAITNKHFGYYNDDILVSSESFLDTNFLRYDYLLCIFDSLGNPKYEIKKNKGITLDSIHYSLNKKGEIISEEHFESGKLDIIIKYEHLNKYDYIERIFESNGKLRLKRYWKYNSNGKEIERIKYNLDGEIEYIFRRTFNCKGELVSDFSLDSNYQIKDGAKNYYKNGKLKKMEFIHNKNEIYSIWDYKYDEYGYSKIIIRKSIKDGNEVVESVFCEKTEYFK